MARLRRNIIASVLGRASSTVLTLIFVPLYLRYLGTESYGLIGLFTTLTVVFSVADLGLSATLTRQLALWSADAGRAQDMRQLTRTFEYLFLAVAGLLLVGGLLSAPLFARHWVQAITLPPSIVARSLQLMVVAAAVQLLGGLYAGALQGLQAQVSSNIIQVAAAVAKGFGALIILRLGWVRVDYFFVWQAIISILQAVVTGIVVWRILPGGKRATFSWSVFAPLMSFSGGVMGISILSILLTQLDKIVLSKVLPLPALGNYMLAATVANAPQLIAIPVYLAVYPRFAQLVGKGDSEIAEFYHRACQWLSISVIPVGVCVGLFAPEAVWAWTGQTSVATAIAPIIRVLVVGFTASGLMFFPYGLQLAYGYTRLTLVANTVAVLVLGPGLVFLAHAYGPLGAAFIWMALNLGYVLICVQIMHRRILPKEQWRWYGSDVGIPLIAATATATIGRVLWPSFSSRIVTSVGLCLIGAFSVAAAMLSSRVGRDMIRGILRRRTTELSANHLV